MPDKRYQYRGSLEDQPLAEMLFVIHQYGVPGVVEAIRGETVKRVYLRHGHIVFASSSEIKESLGYFLLASGMISREDFRSTMRERRESDRRYGSLMVERGLLSPADLHRSIRRQTAEVLWNLFSWDDGEVTFSIGDFDLPSPTAIHVPVGQAIKEGVKRVKHARGLLSRIGAKDTVLKAHYGLEAAVEAALEHHEFSLLKMVDGEKTLYELCAEGPFDAVTNGKMLYVFHVLQIIRSVEKESNSGAIKVKLKSPADRQF